MAKIAPAAQAVLNQANILWPRRRKSSDGTLGDRRHRKTKSDHNPNRQGYVMAVDLSHDPGHGVDAHAWARWLADKRDPRVKYIISNGQIFSKKWGKWAWRRYTGSNPHTKHVHVSIADGHRDNAAPWFAGWRGIPGPTRPPVPVPTPAPQQNNVYTAIVAGLFLTKVHLAKGGVIKKGDRGDMVKFVQHALAQARLKDIRVDGIFGQKTEDAVKFYQKAKGLTPDGIVGAKTFGVMYP